MSREVDADFLALPLDACADAGLSRARELGASHADVRVVSLATSYQHLRNGALEGSVLDDDRGHASLRHLLLEGRQIITF